MTFSLSLPSLLLKLPKSNERRQKVLNHCKINAPSSPLDRVALWKGHKLKKWRSHLLDNLNNCLTCAPEMLQASSAGFEPLTFAMLVQCSQPFQLSYEATEMRSGQLIGLMCSCERHHLSTALHKHFSQNVVSWKSKRPHNVEDNKLIKKKNTTGTGQTMHFCSRFRVANNTLPQVYLESLRVYGTMSVKEIIKFHQVHVENARFLFSLAAN